METPLDIFKKNLLCWGIEDTLIFFEHFKNKTDLSAYTTLEIDKFLEPYKLSGCFLYGLSENPEMWVNLCENLKIGQLLYSLYKSIRSTKENQDKKLDLIIQNISQLNENVKNLSEHFSEDSKSISRIGKSQFLNC
ncbi:hypothetical protein CYY_002783 [Polysphondylium violaceum]|uniref:Uncharacterized protein n=1 Tax=Polysphondylium violaceum TaxID=133409 RepID=A0A8J4PZL0_9MYCE|nr:hypothetical protein CYY_002783 [Polysphondylium violaceum]